MNKRPCWSTSSQEGKRRVRTVVGNNRPLLNSSSTPKVFVLLMTLLIYSIVHIVRPRKHLKGLTVLVRDEISVLFFTKFYTFAHIHVFHFYFRIRGVTGFPGRGLVPLWSFWSCDLRVCTTLPSSLRGPLSGDKVSNLWC